MFYIFLLLFVFILLVFTAILSAVIYHLSKYRLPEKDHNQKIAISFAVISIIIVLINIIIFFNIPWDLLNY